jgi:hypothetical protein
MAGIGGGFASPSLLEEFGDSMVMTARRGI